MSALWYFFLFFSFFSFSVCFCLSLEIPFFTFKTHLLHTQTQITFCLSVQTESNVHWKATSVFYLLSEQLCHYNTGYYAATSCYLYASITPVIRPLKVSVISTCRMILVSAENMKARQALTNLKWEKKKKILEKKIWSRVDCKHSERQSEHTKKVKWNAF